MYCRRAAARAAPDKLAPPEPASPLPESVEAEGCHKRKSGCGAKNPSHDARSVGAGQAPSETEERTDACAEGAVNQSLPEVLVHGAKS